MNTYTMYVVCTLTKIKLRPVFKGGNYSRAETINYLEVLAAETIQGRKLFKSGNYLRKYGNFKINEHGQFL